MSKFHNVTKKVVKTATVATVKTGRFLKDLGTAMVGGVDEGLEVCGIKPNKKEAATDTQDSQ